MKNVLVTGCNGYVGKQILNKLVDIKSEGRIHNLVGIDVRIDHVSKGYDEEVVDICDLERLKEVCQKYEVDTIVHMAAILAPSPKIPVDKMYSINVGGTQNIIECLKEFSMDRIIHASSGAAYGYHDDNPDWLVEGINPIRGNKEFPYSYHKRINEEDFEKLSSTHPQINQFIFRVGTVLGETVDNLITDLFKKPVIMGIKGSDAPFVFIWDKDLVEVFVKAIFSDKPGVYNLAGDGAVTFPMIAKSLRKKYIPIPSQLVEGALKLLKSVNLSQYGPEQVKFLKYRPVLDNKKLKDTFEYIPEKTSHEVFNYYLNKSFNRSEAS